jgi:putative transposase
MQNKFQNKYRIPSSRLQTWDYGTNGAYFITICTQNREHFFGIVQNGTVQLSEIGKISERLWIEIPNQFPFIELGNFVVMPNHVHGILIINKIVSPSVETRFIASNNIESLDNKETRFIASNKIESNVVDDINDDVNEETRLIASLPDKNGGFSGDKNPMLNDFENNSMVQRALFF